MGQFYDHIPGFLIPWIEKQKIFWVASAPLTADGHVNVSPKGYTDKSFHIVRDETPSESDSGEGGKVRSNAVWYEDLSGSGVETISHLRENGRITVLFCGFEGPPRLVRLFGRGKVFEFGTPEYNALLPPEKRQPGSRSVIWIDVYKCGTSCGFSIPFFDYKAPRMKLRQMSMGLEQTDCDAYDETSDELPERGLRNIWKNWNAKSLDGLPGLVVAWAAKQRLGDWKAHTADLQAKDDESESKGPKIDGHSSKVTASSGNRLLDLGFVFSIGVITGSLLVQWYSK